METQLPGWIAIVLPNRANVARAAARGEAIARPHLAFQMRATAPDIKQTGDQGLSGTGRNAWLLRTGIASMAGRHLARRRHGAIEAQCAAIAMPETVARMDQNTERRRLQPFRPHRPLLEGLPWRIGRKIGCSARRLRHRQDRLFRPVVERVHAASIRCISPPTGERLPDRTADIADEEDTGRGSSARQPRRRLPFGKVHRTAQKKSVRPQSRTDRFDRIVCRSGTGRHFGFGP